METGPGAAKGTFGARLRYWIGATDAPRCAFEALALDVFYAHGFKEGGAEWWLQIKEAAAKGIGMHWDKDEGLFNERNVVVHPTLSTVTYLSDHGAPTLLFDRSMPASGHDPGEPLRSGELGAFCETKVGRHLAFPSTLYHGAPIGVVPDVPVRGKRYSFLVRFRVRLCDDADRPAPEAVAATPRVPRDRPRGRGDAAGATWIVRGVAATSRVPRGSSAGSRHRVPRGSSASHRSTSGQTSRLHQARTSTAA